MGCCLPSPTTLGYPLVKAFTVYTIQCGDAPSMSTQGCPWQCRVGGPSAHCLCPDTLVHPLVLLLQRPNCPFPPSCLSLGVLVTFLNLGFLRAWSCDYYHVCGPTPAQSQAQRWSREPVGEGGGSTGSCLHGLQSWRNLAGRPKLKSHLHRTSGASLKGRESPVGTGLQGQHAGRWT